MGIVTRGIPHDIVVALARLNGSTVFVETGTFHGDTTRWASRHFEITHTIERAESLYNLHHEELARLEGVTPHLGDSRTILPEIVRGLGVRRAVFWLDGHWSGGETAGAKDECPLLDELACLADRPEDIILIDDARLFLCAPPPPHDPAQWPTLADIVHALPAAAKRPLLQIVDDVIFVVPSEESLMACLIEYAQARSGAFWAEFGKLHGDGPSLGARLKGVFSKARP